MALGRGVHVVPDADGLFEETLHAAEVDAAVDKVLHGTEMGAGPQSAAPDQTSGPLQPDLSGYPYWPSGLSSCRGIPWASLRAHCA